MPSGRWFVKLWQVLVKSPTIMYNKLNMDLRKGGGGVKLLKKHVKWFGDRIYRDRLDSSAAHSSFFLIISFLPFFALLFTLMQRIHFSDGVSVVERIVNYFPDSVRSFVQGLFPGPLNTGGFVPIAIITAAWTSSLGMIAVIKGLDQIFEVQRRRNILVMRVVALLYVLAFAAVILFTAALLVFGSTIYRFLLSHSSPFFIFLLVHFKSAVGFVLLWMFFTLMYTAIPRRRTRLVNNMAGAVVGAGGWVLFSYFFSLFVENFSNFSLYGSLATLVILMYWLFFCMYIMFIGAEVSMWLQTSGIQEDVNRLWKKRKKRRAREKQKAADAEKGNTP